MAVPVFGHQFGAGLLDHFISENLLDSGSKVRVSPAPGLHGKKTRNHPPAFADFDLLALLKTGLDFRKMVAEVTDRGAFHT